MNTFQPREPASCVGEPTDAAPGSSRKIRVLMERASRREPLFHPKDNLKRRLPNAPPEIDETEQVLEAVVDLVEEDEELLEVEMEIDLAG